MNEKIKVAINDYEKAVKEYRKAVLNNENVNKKYNDFQNDITKGCETFHDKKAAWDANRETIKKMNLEVTKADRAEKIAQAVKLAASQNVANIACNIFVNAVSKDPDKWTIPTHYKKFKDAFYQILDSENFYFSANTYSFRIVFRSGEYGHNENWVYSVKNGCLDLSDDRDKTRNEATLTEIKKEAKQAVKDSEKLRAMVEKIVAADSRKNYKTHISALMPYFYKYDAIKDDYRLF